MGVRYLELSRFNHSCCPNCEGSWDDRLGWPLNQTCPSQIPSTVFSFHLSLSCSLLLSLALSCSLLLSLALSCSLSLSLPLSPSLSLSLSPSLSLSLPLSPSLSLSLPLSLSPSLPLSLSRYLSLSLSFSRHVVSTGIRVYVDISSAKLVASNVATDSRQTLGVVAVSSTLLMSLGGLLQIYACEATSLLHRFLRGQFFPMLVCWVFHATAAWSQPNQPRIFILGMSSVCTTLTFASPYDCGRIL